MGIINRVMDAVKGKVPLSQKRSGHWPALRDAHLLKNPRCAVCGRTDKVQVHHIKPFHLHPDLELDPKNLVTLCESKKDGVNCHLFFGHLGNFKNFNANVLIDAMDWAKKLIHHRTID